MGDENPNAQVEANLLEGKGRYASAGTTLQDIKNDLDSSAAGLQSSWLGGASQDFQDKQGQLTTTVQSASDVLQKGSISIGKMYDSYSRGTSRRIRGRVSNGQSYLFERTPRRHRSRIRCCWKSRRKRVFSRVPQRCRSMG